MVFRSYVDNIYTRDLQGIFAGMYILVNKNVIYVGQLIIAICPVYIYIYEPGPRTPTPTPLPPQWYPPHS